MLDEGVLRDDNPRACSAFGNFDEAGGEGIIFENPLEINDFRSRFVVLNYSNKQQVSRYVVSHSQPS